MLVVSGTAVADCAVESGIRLQVLGSGGPEMTDGRASSGYLVWRGDKAVVMVDAGSGTAFNFEKSGAGLADLQAVLFTHFHVDHSVDFPSLIKASYFGDRIEDLKVLGPSGNSRMPGAIEYVANVLGKNGAYRYLSNYVTADKTAPYKIQVVDVPLKPREESHYQLESDIRLAAVPVEHGPLPAVAWRVEIGDCSISFSGDMNNSFGTLAKLAKDSDMLVANNVIPQEAVGASRFLHMPPSEIGLIAARSKVKQLVLSHRMQRTLGREMETVAEIRKTYSGPLYFADDLDEYELGSNQEL
jgi:ribonuclease BN (tRNA processing enzyme)